MRHTLYVHLNSFAPGRSESDSKNVIFNLVLMSAVFRSPHDNALRWMPQDLTDDKSTFVQVMAWCRQATSHYMSQCWLSSLSPYGVARPQWVNQAIWIYKKSHGFCNLLLTDRLSIQSMDNNQHSPIKNKKIEFDCFSWHSINKFSFCFPIYDYLACYKLDSFNLPHFPYLLKPFMCSKWFSTASLYH